MRRGYADTRAGQVHYRELGEGTPLVLLHKTPASSTMYERVMPSFADSGYRAIAIDTPGYGLSDAPPAPPQELSFYGRAVGDVMDELGIENAHVCGFYTGASIALELATREPRRVHGLVLAGLAAFADEAERLAFRRLIGEYGQMREHLELDAEGRFLELYPLGWFRAFPRADGEHFLLDAIAYLQAARTYSWAYAAVVAYDAYAFLPRVTQPTLCLVPADGMPLVTASTRKAAAVLPDARLVEIPGTSDVAMAEPGTFAGPVLEFLGSLVPAGAA